MTREGLLPHERDFDTQPYSADELRIVKYLTEIAPDIGAGDDPIGFILASHAQLVHDRKDDREEIERLREKLSEASWRADYIRNQSPI